MNGHFYSSAHIDRAAERRLDTEWLEASLSSPRARFVVIWRSRSLVRLGDSPRALTLERSAFEAFDPSERALAFLGCGDDVDYWAVDVSEIEDPAGAVLPSGAELVDLRRTGPLLPPADAGLLAYARALAHFHRNNAFCGRCGAATVARSGGHLRVCSAPGCGRDHFPRTDPAIIVLVTHDDRCLLARQASWPGGFHSVLAGFVEPGESLEDSVRREVVEEVGLQLREVRYAGSQPWPFPASLMLGFTAEAVSDELRVDPDELEEARWLTRDQVSEFRAMRTLRLPPRTSISRRLIDAWLDEPTR